MFFNKLILILALFVALPLSANQLANGFNQSPIIAKSGAVNFIGMEKQLSLKNTQHYDEAKDPAFRRCGTNSDGPQHGFFAVPLLILVIASVALYFK